MHPDNPNKTYGVTVTFHEDEELPEEFEGIVDFWNTWYQSWYVESLPFLMVRYEDLLSAKRSS